MNGTEEKRKIKSTIERIAGRKLVIDKVRDYVDAVARELKSGVATEHSYRPCLKALLEALLPGVVAVNEPSRIDCGAPDFLVRENGPARRPVGYVETKDVGDGDLDGNGVHKEQFDRYKAELSNIVFTDYLDFHFYEDGEFVAKCCVGEVEGSRIVPAAPEEMERFAGLLRHFAEVAPKRIASPSRLAHLMAGKARLLARAVAATLTGGTDDSPNQSPLAQQFMSFRQWLVHDLDVESFADVYAQTIVYGMFAARLHDTTPEDFSRTEAVSLVPRSNPLLRRLFRDLDEYVDDSIVWIIDDLVALFAASFLPMTSCTTRRSSRLSSRRAASWTNWRRRHDVSLSKKRACEDLSISTSGNYDTLTANGDESI